LDILNEFIYSNILSIMLRIASKSISAASRLTKNGISNGLKINPMSTRRLTGVTRKYPLGFGKTISHQSKPKFQSLYMPLVLARNCKFFSTSPDNKISGNLKDEKMEGQKMTDIVQADTGLTNFLRRIYITSGWGLATTLGVSMLGVPLMKTLAVGGVWSMFGVGFLGSIASIYAIKRIPYLVKYRDPVTNDLHDNVPAKPITQYELVSEQSPNRKMAFGALTVFNGITLTPMTAMMMALDPTIIPMAAGLTLTTMAGASMYALNKQPHELTTWGAPLYGALTGFVGMGLVSLLTELIYPIGLGQLWFGIEPYLGIGLFSALTAYDTRVAIKRYQAKDPDHIGTAVEIYLNAVNLLIRFMEIIARTKRND
jgi:FtsH-binding integral membrane protein